MRAWHLVGLPGADGERVRFYPPHPGTPLCLPATIPAGDQEQIMAYYQIVASPTPLPRVELDWFENGIDSGPRRFIQGLRARRGSSAAMLVVKVRVDGVSAFSFLNDSSLRQFEHVVIATQYAINDLPLTNLSALSKHVEQVTRELYREMASEINLPLQWEIIGPLMEALLNPIDIVEVVNSLIDIQLENQLVDNPFQALRQRLLIRLLSSRDWDEFAVIVAHVIDRKQPMQDILGRKTWSRAVSSLERELLLHKGQLLGWAAWLANSDELWAADNPLMIIGNTRFGHYENWREIELWLSPKRVVASVGDEIENKLFAVQSQLAAGQVERAAATLDSLQFITTNNSTPIWIRARYYDVLAHFFIETRQRSEALIAFERSCELHAEVGTSPVLVAHYFFVLARRLQANGRWSDAEPLFARAIRLEEQGQASPKGQAITLREYAWGLMNAGQWTEAEPVFKKALEFLEKDSTAKLSLSITLGLYARGLRDHGRWTEAQELFLRAIDLGAQSGASAVSRAEVLDHYARGLRDVGNWTDSEEVFAKAIKLESANKENSVMLAITRLHYAIGLMANGRQAEADGLVSRSVRFLRGPSCKFDTAYQMSDAVHALRTVGASSEVDWILAKNPGFEVR